MPDLYVPTGASLINALFCVSIIALSILIIKTIKPKNKYVFYGTISYASVVLWHLVTMPPIYSPSASDVIITTASLISVVGLLSSYYFELKGA